MPTFGELLRQFRMRAGLSQSDLAEKAHISEAAVGALERGGRKAPYWSTITLLAEGLGLSSNERAALLNARAAARDTSRKSEVNNNILAGRTSFVGRESDVARILQLLARSRFVTVTGSGGIGKTCVVLEAARQALCAQWGEIWFVDLSALVHGDYIPAKIASAIQPPLTDHAETIGSLASAIGQRRMLLILDNCEHLVAKAAEAADVILEGCPHVSVLATSRENLNVAGEYVYRLPSLADEPAADLFVQRAEAADSRIAFDTETLSLVADVVRHLDGIPLAIELAAAHVPVLGIRALQTRLSEELRVTSGRRDLPARQQTMIATIAWSYDLLNPDEQRLLCDIAIFSGSLSLDAAEAVCGLAETDSPSVRATLASIANKSLVKVEELAGRTRYALLESVRSFALERLRERGRFTNLARRHAQWLAAVADNVEKTTVYMSSERAAELLPDFDNVKAAIAWALGRSEQNDRLLAARVLTGLDGLWDHVGLRREHGRLIESALQLIDEAQHPLAYAYLLAGSVARAPTQRGVLDVMDRAITLCEGSGDEPAFSKLLIVVAQIKAWHGMLDDAERLLDRALPLLESGKKLCAMIDVIFLFARSEVRLRQGRIEDARADIAAAESMALALGDRYYVVRFIYVRRCEIEYASGNVQTALEFAERTVEYGVLSDPQIAGFALGRISNLRLLVGNVDSAVQQLLAHLHDMHGNDGFTYGELECAALALALRGRAIAAARLVGRIRSVEQNAPFQRGKARQDAYDILISSLRQQLDDEALGKAISAGTLLARDEAIDEALRALTELMPQRAP